MEGHKQLGSFSSSSFTSDLFGSKDSKTKSTSSAGIFSTIFPPPTVSVRNSSSGRNGSWQNQPGNQDWNPKTGTSANKTDGGLSSNMPMKNRSSTFQEDGVEPCHLSSSIYYGGQDIYSRSPSSQSCESHPIFKKDGEDDDLNGSNSQAHRGNWWQGSLYY